MAALIASKDFLFVSNGLKLFVMDFKRKTLNPRRFTSSLHPLDESYNINEFSYSEYQKSLKKPFSGTIDASNSQTALKNIMTPFHAIPYEKELQLKLLKNKEAVGKLLRKEKDSFKSSNTIISSGDRPSQYRNQDEFSIGVGIDNDPKTVGFFLKVSEGIVCVPPTEISIIKDKHKMICSMYQDVIRQSKLSAYHHENNATGFWSSISMRTNTKGESFVKIKVNGHVMEETMKELMTVFSKYINRLTLEQVVSKEKLHVIDSGIDFYEWTDDFKLRISDDTHLFSNTSHLHLLNKAILKGLMLKSHNSVLLDLNCGSGILGLHAISQNNCTVIGFDKNVDDAIFNAKENGIKERASYFHGDVKQTIPKFFEIALDSLIKNNQIHVLIRSRDTVGSNVIETLRKSPYVERVVYVTTVPEKQPLFDFINLTRTRWDSMAIREGSKSDPFKFCYASPVDLDAFEIRDIGENVSAKERELAGENPKILTSELSPCGKLLALADDFKRLSIWRTEDMSLEYQTKVDRRITRIAFTPKSEKVVIADKSGDSYICDIPNDKKQLLLGHLSILTGISLNQDGSLIITSDRDEKIRISHFPNAYSILGFCLGHESFVTNFKLLKNYRLISASGDGTLRLWKYMDGSEVAVVTPLKDINVQTDEELAIADLDVIEIGNSELYVIATIEKNSTLVCYKILEEEMTFSSSIELPEPPIDVSTSPSGCIWIICKNGLHVLELKDGKLAFNDGHPHKNLIQKAKSDSFFKDLDDYEDKFVQLRKRILDNTTEYLKRKEERLNKEMQPIAKKTKS